MTGYVTRAQWGARAPTGSRNELSATPKGHAIHWEGPTMGIFDHDECAPLMRSIQSYHMDSKGWSDIAYNLVACPHDYVFEARGKGVGSAANGTTQANKDWYAICGLVGEDDPLPVGLINAYKYAADLCRSWGAGGGSTGHRDHVSTECPGDDLYAEVQAGTFKAGSSGGTTPPTPAPTPPAKAPAFPLPKGHYFGPAEGPDESHSGYYSSSDRTNLAVWQDRMLERGWSLDPYGSDGYYGDVTGGVAWDFQDEKGLALDGLIGAETWGAAWTEPVT